MIPFARIVKYGNAIPKPAGVLKISTSISHVGMLFDNGNLYLRGAGAEYKLGNDSTGFVQDRWIKCPYNVADVWCLTYATIILTTDGKLYLAGQMGYVGVVATSVPGWTDITSILSSIPALGTIKNIASTESTTSNGAILILLSSGDLYGIGRNVAGVLGVSGIQSTPINIDTGVTLIAGTDRAAAFHYVKNGQYYRCGSNARYNLGTSSSSLSTFTVSTDIVGSVLGIACTTNATSVLTSYNGTIRVYSAGQNTDYTLGIGYGDTSIIMSPFSMTPTIYGVVPDAESLNNSCINAHMIAMTQGGKLYTCGYGVALGREITGSTPRTAYYPVLFEDTMPAPDVRAYSVQGGSGLLYVLVGDNEVYWCGSGTFMAEQSTPAQQVKMKKMILPE